MAEIFVNTEFRLAVCRGSVQARPLNEAGLAFLPERDLLTMVKFLVKSPQYVFGNLCPPQYAFELVLPIYYCMHTLNSRR